jgi:ABC-type branched-subunit amino acid transport system substrate-binding protein
VRRRVVVSMIGVALVALLAVAAAQSRSSAGEVKIGWSGDKSGPTVASQAPALAGLKAYIRMTNEAGGVNGNTITLIEKDDAFNVARELENVKSLINDDKVALITGIGNSSGFASILPVLSQSKVPGLVNQGTLKTNTWPFQPYMFQGNCNYGDQADVALAYTMARAKIKDLAGVKVGIAGIEVASGQEWIQTLKDVVTAKGGIPVTQTLPSAVVSADVQMQAFQNEGVKMILMHHGVAGGIAMLRSIAKFGINVPISGSYGVGQDLAFTTAPYEATKNFVPVNCYTVPSYAKLTAKGKLALATGQKYGVPADQLAQANFSLGWVNGMIIVEALKNIKGDVTPASMKAGLESIRNLDTGGLSPKVTLSPKCHMAIQGVRPVTYNWSKKALLPVGTFERWQKSITNSQAAPGTCGKKAGSK